MTNNSKYAWIAALLACCLLLGVVSDLATSAEVHAAPASEGAEVFVSTRGSDDGDGSFGRPFLTLGRAQAEVRALKAQSDGPITVNIRGGEYYMSSSLHLNAEDSGTAESPITWQAYNGETVLLSGGIRLSAGKFMPVSDETMLRRILDDQARTKLLMIDLSGYLDEYPDPMHTQGGYMFSSGGPQLYIGGEPLSLSRYPNDVQNAEYLFADQAEKFEDGTVRLTSHALAARAARWATDAWQRMYAVIFTAWDWESGIFKARAFDAETGAMDTLGYSGIPQEHPRFYVMNLPEEIDLPGECYIDYGKKTIYFYPPEGFENAQIYLSLLRGDLISIDGEAEYITLRGLSLMYGQADGVGAYRVKNITIEGCTIAHLSKRAVTLDGAVGCVVRDCHIYDTIDGSIYLWDGGLRGKLVPSGNVIENNDLHDCNRLKKWTSGSAWCESTGVVIRHNEIHDEAGVALCLSGSNDALVEYNEFYRTGLSMSDTGAIYYGNDPTVLGITIRHNFFHDLGNTYGGVGQQAILCDDGAMMPYIYGNLFVNASDDDPEKGAPIKAHGAQFGIVEGNIFVDSPYAAWFQSWANWDRDPLRQEGWLGWVYLSEDDATWSKMTKDVEVFSPLWRSHYRGTQWAMLWDAVNPVDRERVRTLVAAGNLQAARDLLYEIAPAQTNRFKGNVCVNLNGMFLYNGRGENNVTANTTIFMDYEQRDFRLTPEGLNIIREVIPGFEEIPIVEMGM